MTIYGASKFMTFVAVAAIVLLIFSTVASADQPAIKLGMLLLVSQSLLIFFFHSFIYILLLYGAGRKLFENELPPAYGLYPGGGGYTPTPPSP